MQHRLRCALLSVLSMPFFAGFLLAGEKFEIGSQGASMDLENPWKRKVILAGLGRDQFQRGDGVRVICFEVTTPFDYRSGVEATYDQVMTGMSDLSNVEILEKFPPQWRETGGRIEVSVFQRAKESGILVDYKTLILAENGLQVIFQVFATGRNRRQRIETAVTEILEGFSFPDSSSEWAARVMPRPREFRFDWGQVRVTYRQPLWEDTAEAPDAFFSVACVNDATAFYMYEYDDFEVGSLIEATISYLREVHPSYEPGDRVATDVGGLTGTEVMGFAEKEGHFISCLALPLPGGRALELRFDCPHPRSIAEVAWERWKAGLEVEILPDVTAFPSPPPRPAASVPTPPLTIGRWLSEAEWLGTAPAITARGVVCVDDDHLVYGGRGIQKVAADRSVTSVYETDQTLVAGSVLWDGGEVLIRFGTRLYRRSEEGAWEVADPPSFARTRMGGALWVSRRPPQRSLAGFASLPGAGVDQLIAIGPSGAESVAWQDAQARITWLVGSLDGESIFISRRHLAVDGGWYRDDFAPCFSRSGEGQELSLGSWQIDFVSPAPEGWIVTGRPETTRTFGIYEVQSGEAAELLVSGPGFLGVSASDSSLVISGPPLEPAKGPPTGTALYRVPREVLRKHGPTTFPFGVETLNRIGRIALERVGASIGELFVSQASITSYAGTAHEVAIATTGRRLPTGQSELDAAFESWIRRSYTISTEGFALLTALVCETLFDEGAVWVSGKPFRHGIPARLPSVRSNCYHFATSPALIVSSTLYDEDGYWHPVAEVRRVLQGRKLLLGLDFESLRRRLIGTEDRLWELIGSAEIEPLIEHLRADGDNLYLRREVYDQLAALGRSEDLLHVASEFVKEQEPLFIDTRAVLSARVSLASENDLDSLVEDLQGAIARFSSAPALYALLGEVYVQRGNENDLRRASLCFEKVLELDPDGGHADHARRTLEEIERQPGGSRLQTSKKPLEKY